MKSLSIVVIVIVIVIKAVCGLFDQASAEVKSKAENRLAQVDKVYCETLSPVLISPWLSKRYIKYKLSYV